VLRRAPLRLGERGIHAGMAQRTTDSDPGDAAHFLFCRISAITDAASFLTGMSTCLIRSLLSMAQAVAASPVASSAFTMRPSIQSSQASPRLPFSRDPSCRSVLASRAKVPLASGTSDPPAALPAGYSPSDTNTARCVAASRESYFLRASDKRPDCAPRLLQD
jgi:hypothetical protein